MLDIPKPTDQVVPSIGSIWMGTYCPMLPDRYVCGRCAMIVAYGSEHTCCGFKSITFNYIKNVNGS